MWRVGADGSLHHHGHRYGWDWQEGVPTQDWLGGMVVFHICPDLFSSQTKGEEKIQTKNKIIFQLCRLFPEKLILQC